MVAKAMTLGELATCVEAHEARIHRVEGHVKNCVDSKMVHDDAVTALHRLQTEFRDTIAATSRGAVRVLEQGVKSAVEEFGEPLAVCKAIRDDQRKAAARAKELADAKLERDAKVVRVAKVVGVLAAIVELYRAIRP